jgi:hypothetical protein
MREMYLLLLECEVRGMSRKTTLGLALAFLLLFSCLVAFVREGSV